ncbi:MAG: DNA-binding protein [Acetobacteraceae bacterium]|nr:DNA-binding protein [Acetobacteraceae bacterium]
MVASCAAPCIQPGNARAAPQVCPRPPGWIPTPIALGYYEGASSHGDDRPRDDLGAADKLEAEGAKPTLNAVRKKLGSGSFTTISDAMSQWKERQRQKAVAEPLPGESGVR